jgi:outer membrane protein assembly factor BamE (lipoprotein component of BamABCDE complex)
MNKLKKIMVLENGVEASLLDSILNERGIPHIIKSYHDTALDGIFQTHRGWGHVESTEEYEKEILSIYEDLVKR